MTTAKADTEELMVLVTGTEVSGQDFWAYVAMVSDRHEAFLKAQKNGSYRLNDYGRLLASGFGQSPPTDIMERYGDRTVILNADPKG